jgi:hypothetical protein
MLGQTTAPSYNIIDDNGWTLYKSPIYNHYIGYKLWTNTSSVSIGTSYNSVYYGSISVSPPQLVKNVLSISGTINYSGGGTPWIAGNSGMPKTDKTNITFYIDNPTAYTPGAGKL